MATEFLSGFQFLDWQLGVAAVVGLSSVGLTFIVGRTLLRSRKSEAVAEQKEVIADPFDYGSAAERRNAPRRGGKPVQVLVSDESAQAEPESAVVVNRSLGGLCLSFDREIPEHSILSIRPAHSLVDCPWLQVQVKRCVPRKGGQWEIGCQFIRPPAWAVLLQLS